MPLNWPQILYSAIRYRNYQKILYAIPGFNYLAIAKLNRFHVAKFLIFTFCFVPTFGYFRRAHMRSKFHKQLMMETTENQIQLKQSMQKLEITMPMENDYMVIISYTSTAPGSNFMDQGEINSKEDEDSCRKIYQLYQEHKEQVASMNKEEEEVKWIFMGEEKINKILTDNGFDLQFFALDSNQGNPMRGNKSRSKVYLLGRDYDSNEEKIISEWDLGVSIKIISKAIAKHRYQKYLKSVNF